MAKKRNKKKLSRAAGNNEAGKRFDLPEGAKKGILAVLIFVIAIIIALSFFDLAGVAGEALILSLTFLIGKARFITPLILVLAGLVFFKTRFEKYLIPTILAIFIEVLGIAGILEILNIESDPGQGGWLGHIITLPFFKLFGALVTEIIFGGVILAGTLIIWYLLRGPREKGEEGPKLTETKEEKPSLITKIFSPKFKIKEVEPKIREFSSKEEPVLELRPKPLVGIGDRAQYTTPPLDLLETDKGKASAGDTVTNSTIIKKTLENFGLGVEMSEINIGPTVTQYTLKPADGIKLSKITGLSNNLSLALASHPIRIEAPIPGKSLVGIEVPNKARCQVRLRDLIANPLFQKANSSLNIVLGKDVSGSPVYADLSRMPHLLVAGATGTGKTIFLNSLILSLLYQNSPEILRFILIDPKRVEFSAYHGLPHLLCPVIFDAQKTILSFKWLISEMERRFEVLSGNGSRDISSYNEKVLKLGNEEPLPYIILIVDELADLMAARGREVEVGIVRLAQMARAVGIHLVLATQRPSVEVITGLIKANITSRITFQVASQVDSRTVLDAAGAEKLLGLGDLLFVSAEVVKPKRIQGAYVSEKEVRKVVDWTKDQSVSKALPIVLENHLALDLEKGLEAEMREPGGAPGTEEDPLYEEAKKTVIEAKKASASLLQRRLRLGYARAARLIDILEERGVVGPGEGAKPREVYFASEINIADGSFPEENKEDEEGWKKV